MKNFFLFNLTILCFACAPQVIDTLDIPVTEPVPTVEAPSDTDNPCMTIDKLDSSIREEIEDAYVIYRDDMRAKNYDEAYVLWKKAYYAAPAANGRIRYQFDDGITLYKHKYRNTESDDMKNVYVDSLFSIYDKRIECFPEDEYSVYGKKAFIAYYELQGRLTDSEIFDLFKRAFDGKGADADYFIINPFSRLLYDQVINEKISQEEASKYALSILEIIKNNLAKCEGKTCETWEIINDYSPSLLSNLEGLKGFYPCEYFSDKYYADFEAQADNCEVITEVYRKLRYGQCPVDNAQFIAVKAAYDRKCYVAPPSQGPLKKAYTALNNGQFTEAISLYKEYISTATDMNKKAEIQLRVAKLYYVHIKDFVNARRYARDAAKSKSGWGSPYMLIGKLYASSGPLCGPGRGWDSQIVTWPAIDKFVYAKKIDSSVSPEANKLINQYRKYMPSREDIFQRRLSIGDSFTVPCWIQEKTKIRAAP